jgi:hypothetical protein
MGTPHRTLEIPLYHFDQLSDEAKEKARDWWRDLEASDMAWSAERRESLEAFCKQFPVKAKDWEYDQWSYSITSEFTGTEEEGELRGRRLAAWLWNNHHRVLATRKVYTKGKTSRTSRIIYEQPSCVFTGYCMDDTLMDPIMAFLKKPTGKTLEDLLDDCLQAWGKGARDDVNWIMQDEQVDEAIEANEYEFDEHGSNV